MAPDPHKIVPLGEANYRYQEADLNLRFWADRLAVDSEKHRLAEKELAEARKALDEAVERFRAVVCGAW